MQIPMDFSEHSKHGEYSTPHPLFSHGRKGAIWQETLEFFSLFFKIKSAKLRKARKMLNMHQKTVPIQKMNSRNVFHSSFSCISNKSLFPGAHCSCPELQTAVSGPRGHTKNCAAFARKLLQIQICSFSLGAPLGTSHIFLLPHCCFQVSSL